MKDVKHICIGDTVVIPFGTPVKNYKGFVYSVNNLFGKIYNINTLPFNFFPKENLKGCKILLTEKKFNLNDLI